MYILNKYGLSLNLSASLLWSLALFPICSDQGFQESEDPSGIHMMN